MEKWALWLSRSMCPAEFKFGFLSILLEGTGTQAQKCYGVSALLVPMSRDILHDFYFELLACLIRPQFHVLTLFSCLTCCPRHWGCHGITFHLPIKQQNPCFSIFCGSQQKHCSPVKWMYIMKYYRANKTKRTSV